MPISPRDSNQLEFLTKFQALHALQIDLEVGLGRITVGARATLRGKVNAVATGEAEPKARGFLAQA